MSVDMAGMLEYGAVVYVDVDGIAVTWNGSKTFNVWHWGGAGWTNTDCFTVHWVLDVQEAGRLAREHVEGDESE